MSNFDFNDAGPQMQGGELIPDGTVAKVICTVRPGGQGDGGWLTASKTSDAQYLNCEFTITEGEYAKRKFWANLTWSGGKTNEKGESKGGNITRATLRAMLESAYQIDPKDDSPKAQASRKVPGFQIFDGLQFVARIGVEKAKPGSDYKDKNKLDGVVTPDMPEYTGQPAGVPKATPAAHVAAAAKPAASGGAMPAWMRK